MHVTGIGPWRTAARLAGLLAVWALLTLFAGCAPKAIPVPPKPEPKPETISISEILLRQYDSWKGVSYKFGGAGKSGIDCSGLMRVVFRDGFGLELPRTSIEQSRMGQSVARETIRPGDLLFFSDRHSDHIGVAMGEERFFHASTSEGVTVSELGGYWSPRLRSVRRILDDPRYVASPATSPASSWGLVAASGATPR